MDEVKETRTYSDDELMAIYHVMLDKEKSMEQMLSRTSLKIEMPARWVLDFKRWLQYKETHFEEKLYEDLIEKIWVEERWADRQKKCPQTNGLILIEMARVNLILEERYKGKELTVYFKKQKKAIDLFERYLRDLYWEGYVIQFSPTVHFLQLDDKWNGYPRWKIRHANGLKNIEQTILNLDECDAKLGSAICSCNDVAERARYIEGLLHGQLFEGLFSMIPPEMVGNKGIREHFSKKYREYVQSLKEYNVYLAGRIRKAKLKSFHEKRSVHDFPCWCTALPGKNNLIGDFIQWCIENQMDFKKVIATLNVLNEVAEKDKMIPETIYDITDYDMMINALSTLMESKFVRYMNAVVYKGMIEEQIAVFVEFIDDTYKFETI